MRTFITIDLPQEVKYELANAQRQLSSAVANRTMSDSASAAADAYRPEVDSTFRSSRNCAAAAKMSLAHDFHLTLKFLGEITPAKMEVVKGCLSNVKFKSFTAAVSGIGVFPSENHVRVVWIGVEPEDGFIRLQKLADDALEREFPKDKDFKPHLTLARMKFVSDKERFIQQLRQIKINNVKFSVDSFKLKRSILTNKGAVYEDLAVYKLS